MQLALLVQPEHRAHRVLRELPAISEPLEPRDRKAFRESPGSPGLLVARAQLVPLDPLVAPGRLDRRAIREFRAQRALKVHRVFKELLARRVSRASPDRPVQPGLRARKVSRAIPVRLVPLAPRVLPARKGRRASQELRDQPGLLAHRVLLVRRARPVRKVSAARRAFREPRGLPAPQDRPGRRLRRRVLRDLPVSLGRLALRRWWFGPIRPLEQIV